MRTRIPFLISGFLALAAVPAHGQDSSDGGSTGAAIGLAALGLGAGGLLTGAGSLVPCTETAAGPACVRLFAFAGGALGLVDGALIGARDEAQAEDRLVGGGIGLGVGLAVALAAGPRIENFTWRDGMAFGALGAAIGTAPVGAGVGFAAGSLVGLALWKIVPGVDLPDAVAIALGGLAVGALADWTVGAIDADDAPSPALTFSVPVGL